jgi:hypothetical protein
LDLATKYAYSSKESVQEIVQRMVANGMSLSKTDLENIVRYIEGNFVK